MADAVQDAVLQKYQLRAKTWFNSYMRYIVAHYVMSGVAVIFSAIIAWSSGGTPSGRSRVEG